ncbi:MAG: hypothetical protein AAF481_09830 [Acidobacteriota bacterium]
MRAIASDWRRADLVEADRALCTFAETLTADPASHRRHHVETLRRHGFGDAAIHDAVQAIAYFNYINRVADALGVEPEEGVAAWEQSAAPAADDR